jgi:tetratricopeptide (TPR) repeat protein
VLAAQRNDADGAQKAFEDAASILEPLVEQQPLDLEQKWLLATCLRLIGDSLAGGDDPDLCISYYQRALTPLLALANRNPEVMEYQSALAGLYMNLANVQKSGARKAALDSLNSAIVLMEVLNKTKTTPSQQRDLAVALRTRAELSEKDADATALLDLENSLEILKGLVRAHPDRMEFAQELLQSQTTLRERSVN